MLQGYSQGVISDSGNSREIGIFQTFEMTELKWFLYEIFLCESFPGCVPKGISIIWPNSQVMGKGAVLFENFMRHDDDCHCPDP